MPTPSELAVQTYVDLIQEPDRDRRAPMFEAAFADDVEFVTQSRVIRGRAALVAEIEGFLARGLRVQMLAPIDVKGSIFRLYARAVREDGSSAGDAFDAGRVGDDGRIALILTFPGPLPGF